MKIEDFSFSFSLIYTYKYIWPSTVQLHIYTNHLISLDEETY